MADEESEEDTGVETYSTPRYQGEALERVLQSAAGFRRAATKKLRDYGRQAIEDGMPIAKVAEVTHMDVDELRSIVEDEG